MSDWIGASVGCDKGVGVKVRDTVRRAEVGLSVSSSVEVDVGVSISKRVEEDVSGNVVGTVSSNVGRVVDRWLKVDSVDVV